MLSQDECCGSGCNNCILDRLLGSNTVKIDKINLFSQKEYQKFRVLNIEKIRHAIYAFTFQLLESAEPYKTDEQLIAPPVSFLMLRAPKIFEGFNPLFNDTRNFFEQDGGRKVTPTKSQPEKYDKGTPEDFFSRKYTPYIIDEELRTFTILVKLEKFGKMSKFLMQIDVGYICEFKGPFLAFDYVHEKFENYVVITQGISVVSAFRLVKEIIRENAQSRIAVISCFKNLNETFLREEFFKLTHFWCLKHHTFLSQASPTEDQLPIRIGEKIHNERLSAKSFRELMRDLKYFDPKRTQVLISGRDSFADSVRLIVAENHYKSVDII